MEEKIKDALVKQSHTSFQITKLFSPIEGSVIALYRDAYNKGSMSLEIILDILLKIRQEYEKEIPPLELQYEPSSQNINSSINHS